jgi:hypothetical protein
MAPETLKTPPVVATLLLSVKAGRMQTNSAAHDRRVGAGGVVFGHPVLFRGNITATPQCPKPGLATAELHAPSGFPHLNPSTDQLGIGFAVKDVRKPALPTYRAPPLLITTTDTTH